MNNKDQKIALLVHSCDRYELLYKGFEYFFSKYWSFEVNCNYYFATEDKCVSIDGFKNICSGKGEWSDRLTYLLKECIQEPYVLYFQEDMWLNKPIYSSFFEQLFEKTISNNWQQVKLHSSEVYSTIPTDNFIEGFNVSVLHNEKSNFLMSHQVTLWNKEFLLKQLHRKEHPWRNERKGTKRLRKINPQIFHIDYFAENGSPAINKNSANALRSEYNTVSVNGVLSNKIENYIETLGKADDNLRIYASKLEYNYQNNVTHDGKAKPKKVDIFKKIKNWFVEK